MYPSNNNLKVPVIGWGIRLLKIFAIWVILLNQGIWCSIKRKIIGRHKGTYINEKEALLLLEVQRKDREFCVPTCPIELSHWTEFK